MFPFHTGGGRGLDIDQCDRFGAEPESLRGGVATDVPRPDDHDTLSHCCLIELACPEKIEGCNRPLMTGERDEPRLLSPYGDHDGIEFLMQLSKLLFGQRVLQGFVGDLRLQTRQLMV